MVKWLRAVTREFLDSNLTRLPPLIAYGEWDWLYGCYGLFPLPDSDSDSDSKPYGYIVSCRTCFHWLTFRFRSLSQSICIVQESVSESKSESGKGNKPLKVGRCHTMCVNLRNLLHRGNEAGKWGGHQKSETGISHSRQKWLHYSKEN